MDKRARRKDCFARVRALSLEEKAAHSRSIVRSLEESEPFADAGVVFAYVALASEPDLGDLFVRHPEKSWAFSRVTEEGLLSFHAVRSPGQLREGRFGFLEPDPERCPVVDFYRADLILVPGVSFDPESGARLGRGRGHYDRFLSRFEKCPPIIGVAFSTQLSTLEPEPHDIPMSGLVTEKGFCSGWHDSVPRAN